MLSTVVATRFDKLLQTGRTTPALMSCENSDQTEVEVVVKFSAACERGSGALAIEALLAMLASDLGLPVPEPFLVLVDTGVIDKRVSPRGHEIAFSSVAPSFGSKRLPAAFVAMASDKKLESGMLSQAAEVFAFDAMMFNPDRRHAKPNCLSDGRKLAIFDHEAALAGLEVLGTFLQPFPWTTGSLSALGSGPGQHVFFTSLAGKSAAFDRFVAAWGGVTDARLSEYRAAIPASWQAQSSILDQAIQYISDLRQHVPTVIDEVRRVLA